MVVYDDGSPEPVRVFDHGVVYKDPETFGEYKLSYRTGDILSPKIDVYEPIVEELDDFLAAIRDGGESVSNASLARDVVRLAEAADDSMRLGGAEVTLGSARRFVTNEAGGAWQIRRRPRDERAVPRRGSPARGRPRGPRAPAG